MRFYSTLAQAAQEEIIPMLQGVVQEFDVEGLAAEVFTVDPASGTFTHTGEGITDEMLDRHEN